MSNETYINTGTSFQQPFNDRRPVQQSYQYNNQESKRRPVQQSYQYNNVETRRRPSRVQVNAVEDRRRSIQQTYQYSNVESKRRPVQQDYTYHNQIPRRRPVQQPYSYHNRIQQNTRQTYTYHNRVTRRRPVQQTYQYHNRVQQDTQQPYQYHNRVTRQRPARQPYTYHNRIQADSQQPYTYHNRVPTNTQQVYVYHNRTQENTQQPYQYNNVESRQRPVRNQAFHNHIHFMNVYGGGSDAIAVRMDNPYSQTTTFVPSFEYTPAGAQEQNAGVAGRYPFSYQVGGVNYTKDGNLHEGDSFRGAMFFRGPTLNFAGGSHPVRTPTPTGQQPTPAASQAGTGAPYYSGAGNQLIVTNYESWSASMDIPAYQAQRQYQGALKYIGNNTILAADIIASPTSQNQSVPNPQRQGHPQGQGTQGVEFLSQHPNPSQFSIKVNSDQSVRLGWEHFGQWNEQIQYSPGTPRAPNTFLRGRKDLFSRVRTRNVAHQSQFAVGTFVDWIGQGQPNPAPVFIGYINDKQQPAQQSYTYHNRVTRTRPVRTQRNADEDRRRPVRVQVLSVDTKQRTVQVQALQPLNAQRSIQQGYQYNNIEIKTRPVRVQLNAVEERRRPVQQTYQYNNVETKQRPVQQIYEYHNRVSRQRPARQPYQYHNRVQQNTQQTYEYHNRVPRRRPVQQTYTYHNQIPRRRPVRQPFPSTRPIGPLAKVKQIWINDGGVLRKMDEVYINDSGNLRKTHQTVPTSQLTDPNT